MDRGELEQRVRAICPALPGTTARLSHGAPAFCAGKQFLMLWPDGHHDRAFPHLWCAAPPGGQDVLVASDPDRFFRPPSVGGRGWVGLRLDHPIDWEELAGLCEEAFLAVAPKRLVAGLVRKGGRSTP